MSKLTGLLLIVLPLVATVANAELYRWVDAQGKVHYSDTRPPADARGTRKLSSDLPPSPLSPAAKPKSWQEKDQEFKTRRAAEAEARAKAQKEAEQAEQKKKNCEAARRNLQLLESGQRIVTMNAQGEREYLDEGARQKAIEDARKAVESWCK